MQRLKRKVPEEHSGFSRPVWKMFKRDDRRLKKFKKELKVSEVVAQLLLNRGVRTVKEAECFLYGSLSSLHDPFRMKDMRKAVERIKTAISNGQKILVYGDYDVDGVTSCALLSNTLKELGADFKVYIPNRLDEGYGVNSAAVKKASEDGIDLIVTVDCGINSVDEVLLAKSLGLDIVITDHHEIKGRQIPDACAVVDPHRADCEYPYKYLAGVGVAYKLAMALSGMDKDPRTDLDLVALGSIADIVPLNGENRTLVKFGLKELQSTKKPGLKALKKAARIDDARVGTNSISFGLAPRINAMGRMGSAESAFKLLVSSSSSSAKEFTKELEQCNKDRRKIEKEVLKEARDKAEREVDVEQDKIVVLAGENWHPGVIGIVASRISDQYGLPSILIGFDGSVGKGSGRGREGIDLFRAVQSASDHLIKFGGHEHACGLTIKKQELDLFKLRLNEAVKKMAPEKLTPKEVIIDFQLPFSYVSNKLIEELKLIKPYGRENSKPLFATGGLKVKNSVRNIGQNGFKFHVSCGNIVYEAISFRRGALPRPKKGNTIDLVFSPQINSYRGIESIQLNIVDLRITSER